MASLIRIINAFELAIILANASKKPEELASNIDLNKLTRLINQHFAEVPNAGRTPNLGATAADVNARD